MYSASIGSYSANMPPLSQSMKIDDSALNVISLLIKIVSNIAIVVGVVYTVKHFNMDRRNRDRVTNEFIL